jgi:hypothetical protein
MFVLDSGSEATQSAQQGYATRQHVTETGCTPQQLPKAAAFARTCCLDTGDPVLQVDYIMFKDPTIDAKLFMQSIAAGA